MEKFKPIKFPRDESVHNHIIEWWYWNGNLKDTKGNKYAFMSCLFRADTKKVKIPFLKRIPLKIIYFYHSIVSDIKKQKSYPLVELISAVSKDSFQKPLFFVNHTTPQAIIGYVNRVMEETKHFSYDIKDENLDLKLTAIKKPLLEGGKGYVDVHAKKSYYYSLTNIKTEGKIRVNNKWIHVSGKSWMDHQWANTAYTKDKWTWFSIQLDDNREIVCYEYDDTKVKTYLASISNKNGSTEHFKKVQIIPLGLKWTSKKTKAVYPLSWKIIIPEKDIVLSITPLIKEQEIVFGTINYWEGPTSIKGNFGKKKVTGQGFMELEGYPSKYSNINFAEDTIGKVAKEAFRYAKKNIF